MTESRKTLGLSDRQDSTGVGLMETIINGKTKQNKTKNFFYPTLTRTMKFFGPIYDTMLTGAKCLLALGERGLGTCQERGLCD